MRCLRKWVKAIGSLPRLLFQPRPLSCPASSVFCSVEHLMQRPVSCAASSAFVQRSTSSVSFSVVSGLQHPVRPPRQRPASSIAFVAASCIRCSVLHCVKCSMSYTASSASTAYNNLRSVQRPVFCPASSIPFNVLSISSMDTSRRSYPASSEASRALSSLQQPVQRPAFCPASCLKKALCFSNGSWGDLRDSPGAGPVSSL